MPAKAYDWDEWFSHDRFTLYRWEHYDTTQESLCQQIRNAAVARGLKVSLRGHDDGNGVDIVVTQRAKERQLCLLSSSA